MADKNLTIDVDSKRSQFRVHGPGDRAQSLRNLVRLLARQAARDWLASTSAAVRDRHAGATEVIEEDDDDA